jgi:hypothetical protein
MNDSDLFYSIPALLKHQPNQNKDSLLGKGFLTRRGSAMIVGPAGVGKSKFTQHLAFSMALGMDFVGIKVNAKSRVLLIQAEDVIDDIAESIQGFVSQMVGADKILISELTTNLHMATVDMLVGQDFTKLVDRFCQLSKPDVVIIDPLVAFIGCDLVDQGAVTSFLRHDLGSVVRRHKCGLICVHHTKRGDKGGPAVERAFGGMEFSAFFRGILDLTGDSKEYREVRVKVTKRQRQLQLADRFGNPTDAINITMGKDTVQWTRNEQCLDSDSGATAGRPRKVPQVEVDRAIAEGRAGGEGEAEIVGKVAGKFGYSRKQAGRLVKLAAPGKKGRS